MKLNCITESLSTSDIEILTAWQRGEIEPGDNLHDSLLDIFKRLKTQVAISESTPNLKQLKKKRRSLSDDEWEKVQDAKAVWEDGKSGVWKAVIDGKTFYVANTHRTSAINSSLDATIKDFLGYVKDSS